MNRYGSKVLPLGSAKVELGSNGTIRVKFSDKRAVYVAPLKGVGKPLKFKFLFNKVLVRFSKLAEAKLEEWYKEQSTMYTEMSNLDACKTVLRAIQD